MKIALYPRDKNLDLRLRIALMETAFPQVDTRVSTIHTSARRISTQATACWFHIMVTGGADVTTSSNLPPPDEPFRTLPEISTLRVLLSIGITTIGNSGEVEKRG